MTSAIAVEVIKVESFMRVLSKFASCRTVALSCVNKRLTRTITSQMRPQVKIITAGLAVTVSKRRRNDRRQLNKQINAAL